MQHVHCHFASHPALAGFVIHRLTGIPFSFTAHGSDLHVDRTMLPQKVAEAAFVATISEDNRRLILAECGERFADRVHVIRAGVDTSLFTPHAERQPAHRRAAAPAVRRDAARGQGPGAPRRGLQAAGRRRRRRALRLVGDGPDRPALEQAIAAAGLQDRVVLAGPRTREEVAADLAASDVLVAPSVPTKQGRREGIPVVLMEAMSSGLPVVASGISGIPELVDDGWNGLLVPPGDPAALAGALQRLAVSASLRGRLGAEGRRTVERGFDVERSADELVRRFAASANGRTGR